MASLRISRREFIQTGLIGTAFLCIPIDAFTSLDKNRKNLLYATSSKDKFYLHIYSLNDSSHSKREIPFRVHSLKKLSEDLVLLIEKKGQGLVVLNMKSGEITKIMPKLGTDVFYGHAEIDFESKKIFIPEGSKRQNVIYVRSLETFEILGAPIYQTDKEIHMISFLEKDRLAICLDDNKESAIDVLNTTNMNVTKHPILNNYFRPGHILHVEAGNMFVSGIAGSGYESGAVLNYNFKKLEYCEKETFVKLKPVFWMANHPKSQAICAVSPYSNSVVFLDRTTHKLILKKDVESPYGVDVFDDNFVVISTKGLFYFKSKNLKQTHKKAFPEMENLLEDFHPLIA